MAYTDRVSGFRLNPAGLGGSLMVSGGMLALIAFAAPDVVFKAAGLPTTKIFFVDTVLPDVVPDPATPPPVVQKEASPPPERQSAVASDNNLLPPPQVDPVPYTPPVGPVLKPPPLEPRDPEPTNLAPPRLPVKILAVPDKRFASGLQPPYPPEMVRAEKEGRATVRVLIGADGRVRAVTLVRADDSAFFRATEKQALDKWRFKPATEDGKPVESWKEMTVTFRLEGR